MKIDLSSLGDLADKVVVESNAIKLIRRFPSPRFIIHDIETNGLYPFKPCIPLCSNPGGTPLEFTTTDGAVPFAHFFGVYDEQSDKLYVSYTRGNDSKETLCLRKHYLENKKVTKVGHNYKFDWQVCKNGGVKIRGPIFDTLTASRLLYDRLPSHTLKYLGNHFSGISGKPDRYELAVKSYLTKLHADARKAHPKVMKYRELSKPMTAALKKRVNEEVKERYNYSCLPDDLLLPYGIKDIVYTFVLFAQFYPTISTQYKRLFRFEMELIHLVNEMEQTGIRINPTYCTRSLRKCKELSSSALKQVRLEAKKLGVASLNLNSPKQMLGFFKDSLLLDDSELKNKQHKVSTDKYVVERLAERHQDVPFFRYLLQYRTYSKLATYFKGFREFTANHEIDRLHCGLKVSDTATGRTACANPNLQNIPNQKNVVVSVRQAFVPERRHSFLLFDYSQIEMILFALFCQDERMIQAVNAGKDFHAACAEMVFGEVTPENRKSSKAINFGLIYGMGLPKLAVTLGVSYNEASIFKEKYLNVMHKMTALMLTCKRMIYERGFVEDLFGRRYHVPTEQSYKAVNALIQGCAANVLKMAMIQLQRYIKFAAKTDPNNLLGKCRILLPIHDELILEVPVGSYSGMKDLVPGETVKLIKHIMEHIAPVTQYGITTTVEPSFADKSWQDKQDYVLDKTNLERAKKTMLTMNEKSKKQFGKALLFDATFSGRPDWFINAGGY